MHFILFYLLTTDSFLYVALVLFLICQILLTSDSSVVSTNVCYQTDVPVTLKQNSACPNASQKEIFGRKKAKKLHVITTTTIALIINRLFVERLN